MKEKLNKKDLFRYPLLIGIIISIVATAGISYGAVEYKKTSNLVNEAKQLAKEEKYSEANKKLEFTKDRWLVKTLGIQKEKIFSEIENNKKLFEDKLEYVQGVEEFNKENWDKAKELLSKISKGSPYYQDADDKMAEIQEKIIEQRIAEVVTKITAPLEKKLEGEKEKRVIVENQRQATERKAEKQIGELKKSIEEAKRAVKYVTEDTDLLELVNHQVIRSVPKGTKVTIIEQVDLVWSKAKIDTQEGWIENQYLVDSISQAQDPTSIIKQWKPIVGRVECEFRYTNNSVYLETSGSGIAMKFSDYPLSVITNKHILTDESGYGAYSCAVTLTGNYYTYNSEGNQREIKVLSSGDDGGYININNPDNYITNLTSSFPKTCKNKPIEGDEIIILGYPDIGSKESITITKGIISGFEEKYYITDAKIDQGNSGGAAILLKDNCLLGLPTYARLGGVESLGRILDISAFVVK